MPLSKSPDASWRSIFQLAWSVRLFEEPSSPALPAPHPTAPVQASAEPPGGSSRPAAEARSLAMRVVVRFRPLEEAAPAGEDSDGTQPQHAPGGSQHVVLPLHQRLQLLRQRHGCSAAEARMRLWASAAASGQDPFEGAVLSEAPGGSDATIPAVPAELEGEGSGPTSAKAAAHEEGHAALAAAVLAVQPQSVLVMAPSGGLRQARIFAPHRDSPPNEDIRSTRGLVPRTPGA